MYNIHVMTDDNTKMVVMFQGQPAYFDTDLDAWDFIRNIMAQQPHPKFAWVVEVDNA